MSIDSDLIRGHVDTIILRTLAKEDKYGYEIIDDIQKKSDGTYEIKQPTLYSCLKRLENQGLISSYWVNSDIGGRRHYYKLTEKGREEYNNNMSQWVSSRSIIDKLLGDSAEYTTDENTKIDGTLSNTKITEEDIKQANQTSNTTAQDNEFNATDCTDPNYSSDAVAEPAVVSQMSINSGYAIPEVTEEDTNPYLENTEDNTDESINLTSDVDYSVIADYYKTDNNQIDIFTPTALEEQQAEQDVNKDNQINDKEIQVENTQELDPIEESVIFDEKNNANNTSFSEDLTATPDSDVKEDYCDIFVNEETPKQSIKFNLKDYKTNDKNFFNSNYGESDYSQDSDQEETDNDDFDYSVFDSASAEQDAEENTSEEIEETETEDPEETIVNEPRFGFYDHEEVSENLTSTNDEQTEDEYTSSALNWGNGFEENDDSKEESDSEVNFVLSEENADEDNEEEQPEFSDNRFSQDYLLENLGYNEKQELTTYEQNDVAIKESQPVMGNNNLSATETKEDNTHSEADLFIDNKRTFVPQYTDNDTKEILNTLSAYGTVKLRPESVKQEDHRTTEPTSIEKLRYDLESEGINVREYHKRVPDSGDTKYYCLVNKLKMSTALISYAILVALLFVSYFIAKSIGYTNLNLYSGNGISAPMHFVVAGLIFLIVPAVYLVLFLINPTKKVRPKYSAKVGIVFALLLFIQCLVIDYVLNISFGLMSFTQIDYNHLNWFVPAICSLYILIHSITYSILYKTKKFHI
ncbi:MAG: helix-turn-helix transcriptional regulator [Christensenellales bacterium]